MIDEVTKKRRQSHAVGIGLAWLGTALLIALVLGFSRALGGGILEGVGVLLVGVIFFGPVAFLMGWLFGMIFYHAR